jgi:hypothetical protein
MFDRIPAELKAIPQWVVWNLVEREGQKATKVPIQALNGFKASVTDPSHWCSYDDALANVTKASGLGFVLTPSDPYIFIDLDDCHNDAEAFARQQKIVMAMDSYSELSPSGAGLHIIVKAIFDGPGRRRSYVELYPSNRFMTMTGNVFIDKPIAERQEIVETLYNEMGGDKAPVVVGIDKPQTQSDEEVISMASLAVNGEKFRALYDGDWQQYYGPHKGHQGEGRSEADFAFIDIVAFYTQNKEQIRRLFKASQLGQAPKDNYAHRADRVAYVNYMVEKSFDRQLPPLDLDNIANLRIAMQAQYDREQRAKAVAVLPAPVQSANGFPPGLLGQVAQFILDAAPRPVPEIALAGAIAFLSGITGRAYNTYTNAGLNQYILLLAPTGTGKDSIADGISKLFAAMEKTVPLANDFRGPGELVSSAGLIKWIERKPCVLSIVGEIGLMMQQMAHPQANSHLKGLQRTLTQMYSKSGFGKSFDPSAYSDKEKNSGHIHNPSLTLLGESVPGEFYSALDESLIANGLLPRFTIFEYKGDRPYMQEGKEGVKPPAALVQALCDLTASSLAMTHNNQVHQVQATEEAKEKFREFDRWTTDQINGSENAEVVRHLWNRAHLKALKLASVYAVSNNYLAPVVDMEACIWATNLINSQTEAMISKFDNNEVGDVSNSEGKQAQDLINVISSFLLNPHDKYSLYGGTPQMHADGVFMLSHLSRRIQGMSSYRLDRLGATNALKRAIQHLLDGDEIAELPKMQIKAKYGNGSRCFVVTNSKRFTAMAAR